MSYEGYVQCICEQGHYWEQEEPYNGKLDKCECNADPAWTNRVDDTNCDTFGVIPYDVLVEHFAICPDSQEHLFKVPNEEETKPLQCYWKNGEFFLVKDLK